MPIAPTIEIIEADLGLTEQADAFRQLLNAYAKDPMGGGKPLPDDILERLPQALAQRSDSYSLIAYCDGKPAGLLNAFEGFSTFACAPLLNIHDVIVAEGYRGLGLADQLLEAAEGIARRTGCCKLTLEVLENNTRAQTVYRRCGYAGYELDPETGRAMFWQKVLRD
ncbi:GNAT family N-acetyltransferase [Marinobacterium sp. D7]|uniref:GNAT family N-acetyltransferase n=1 Tax=Marinobacterium ramblicola TaxID=2849041 RepID=UPI001C2D2DE0|nr:GNAT family N-acetyltransferase [Marinobacterium ramblicola]MBV1790019.1 GNAT family N-acetyltransferase [Marinobacterium ramblicola]